MFDQYSEQFGFGSGLMKKPSLIVIGAGGHAKSCIDVIEQHGHYSIGGLVGMPAEIHMRITPAMITIKDFSCFYSIRVWK